MEILLVPWKGTQCSPQIFQLQKQKWAINKRRPYKIKWEEKPKYGEIVTILFDKKGQIF